MFTASPFTSRFENSFYKHDIFRLLYGFIDQYVLKLKGRKEVIIDIDATDAPTHGSQQLSLFNGFYGQFMYNELFFHDGETGEVILPVLRPGNSHSNKWYVSILKRVVEAIRKKYPEIKITIRAYSPELYELSKKYHLTHAMGIAGNKVLKNLVSEKEKEIREQYGAQGEKHQSFVSNSYQAKSWKSPEVVHSKIESTRKGVNIRHIVATLRTKQPKKFIVVFM